MPSPGQPMDQGELLEEAASVNHQKGNSSHVSWISFPPSIIDAFRSTQLAGSPSLQDGPSNILLAPSGNGSQGFLLDTPTFKDPLAILQHTGNSHKSTQIS